MKRFEKIILDKLFFNEKPKRTRKPKMDYDLDDIDVVAVLRREQLKAKETLHKLDEFFKEHEKLNKKEEKKGNSFGISTPQLAMLIIASFPITAPLYVQWFRSIMGW